MDKTSFNLDLAIQLYLQQLNKDQNILTHQLDEIQDHLYSEIEELGGKGLSDEECLVIAKLRLGKQEDLSKDYKHINETEIQVRKILGFIGVAFVFKMIYNLSCLTSIAAYLTLSSSYPLQEYIPIDIGIRIVSTLILAFLAYHLIKKYGDQLHTWRFLLFILSCEVVFRVLSFIVLPGVSIEKYIVVGYNSIQGALYYMLGLVLFIFLKLLLKVKYKNPNKRIHST